MSEGHLHGQRRSRCIAWHAGTTDFAETFGDKKTFLRAEMLEQLHAKVDERDMHGSCAVVEQPQKSDAV